MGQELQLAAMARRISRGAQLLHRAKLRLGNRNCCCHDLAIEFTQILLADKLDADAMKQRHIRGLFLHIVWRGQGE